MDVRREGNMVVDALAKLWPMEDYSLGPDWFEVNPNQGEYLLTSDAHTKFTALDGILEPNGNM
jgi:hypothetical protein